MRVRPFTRFRCRILRVNSDIRELARNLLESDRELYFKRPNNIHGKLDAPSLIKYKVMPGGVIRNLRRKQLIHCYCVALIL